MIATSDFIFVQGTRAVVRNRLIHRIVMLTIRDEAKA